jgi:hydrogenase expression/formation protein HypE
MSDRILLSHGSGGQLSHDLIAEKLVTALGNPVLDRLDDSAVLEMNGRLAFTTDSYTVSPIFFPGGDIGKLAVCGTVNDLATSGAVPRYLSLSLIIEEGLLFEDLDRIIASIAAAASEAEVIIVTGDTKVVNKGNADRIFINTAGIGVIPEGIDIAGRNARPGDKIIINGPIGNHGIAILSQRAGIEFEAPVVSDCAPLNGLVADILSPAIHSLRDPTRGGLAVTLNELAGQSGTGMVIYEDSLPVDEAVRAAGELLGFDPMYLANEGKIVAVVAQVEAERILTTARAHPGGREAAVIGEVVTGHPGQVVMRTRLGASRLIDMPVGELLPRIC